MGGNENIETDFRACEGRQAAYLITPAPRANRCCTFASTLAPVKLDCLGLGNLAGDFLRARHGTRAIEIKRTRAPRLEKGFRIALDDIKPDRAFVVYGGEEGFPMGNGVEAVSVRGLAAALAALSWSETGDAIDQYANHTV